MAVKGLDITGVNKIKSALQDYRDAINKIKIGEGTAVIQKAFKGSYVSQISTLSKEIDSKLASYTRNLIKEFEDITSSIQSQYKTQDSNASAIKNTISSLKS